MLSPEQEDSIAFVYHGLRGILDGLSLQDGKLDEVIHLRDHVINLKESIEDNFPELELTNNCVNEPDDGMSDVEADADALKNIGWGTDEDYGGAHYEGDF